MKALVRQFFSYFIVGGTAALVEWASFGSLVYLLHINHMLATVLAFVAATFVNWFLGRLMTFKASCNQNSLLMDCAEVFLASLVGLVFNLVLMFVFVDLWAIQQMFSKIFATGIVFIWNFMIRKFVIYRG